LAGALKKDYREANLNAADQAMLDYVSKLTIAPASVIELDIQSLRENGFSDKAILEINQITGFFAWCNRTVDGLGVELEDFWNDPDATNV